MVGKPNFPQDAEGRSGMHGAASRPTPGLSPIDEEREASMADEGGASGAVMESEGDERPRVLAYDSKAADRMCEDDLAGLRRAVRDVVLSPRVMMGAGIGAALALGFFLVRTRLR